MKKTIEDASIKRDDDDDSDSSSSEEDNDKQVKTAATKPVPTYKQTAAPTKKVSTPGATQKVSARTRTTLKPSKPVTVDCEKDHKVSVKDDNTISGVITFRSCHASRIQRKPSRGKNVGDRMGSLLADRVKGFGLKDRLNLNIIKTSGDKQATDFYYQIPCRKEDQQTVIEQMKDVCKDKNLTDTVTHENEPDEDDSSSESDEDAGTTTQAKVTQKEVTRGTTHTEKTAKPTTAKQPSSGSSMYFGRTSAYIFSRIVNASNRKEIPL